MVQSLIKVQIKEKELIWQIPKKGIIKIYPFLAVKNY